MDLKQIEKLMIAMGRNGMKRFSIKREGLELELEREVGRAEQDAMPLFSGFSSDRGIPSGTYQMAEKYENAPTEEKEQAGDFINSPLVGTFYCAPSPDSQPFVKVGDMVSEDTVVCIVEAMKVMNEVKAGMSGRLVEVLITNGDPVQYGSKLFRIIKV